MKKRTLIAGKLMATGLLSVFLVLGSCQKEEVELKDAAPSTPDTETIQDVERITNNFIRTQATAEGNNDRIPGWLKKLAGHVLDDLKGGAVGAGVGGVFGGVGGIIGAGVGAAAGTLAGMNSGEPIVSDDGGAVNPANAFDRAGTIHNDLLYAGYAENYELIYDADGNLKTDAFVAFADTWLGDNGYIAPGTSSGYTVAMLNEDLAFVALHDELNMTEYVPECLEAGEMSEVESDVLTLYYTGMESAASVEAFIDYSIAVEREITASGYSAEEKEYILSCMAVTRQDVYFWNLND